MTLLQLQQFVRPLFGTSGVVAHRMRPLRAHILDGQYASACSVRYRPTEVLTRSVPHDTRMTRSLTCRCLLEPPGFPEWIYT